MVGGGGISTLNKGILATIFIVLKVAHLIEPNLWGDHS